MGIKSIEYYNTYTALAEKYYEQANNNLDDALYDIHRLGVDYDGQLENYLLLKYAPDRYTEKIKKAIEKMLGGEGEQRKTKI